MNDNRPNVITAEQARAQGVSARSLMKVAEWNDKRGRTLRHRQQAQELRRVAAQLAAANDNRRAGRRAA